MVKLVQDFVLTLREAGFRISPSEIIDCTKQLEIVNFLEESCFKTVLRANFVKNIREQDKFNLIYHLFFHEMRSDISIAQSGPLADTIDAIYVEIERKSVHDNALNLLLDFLKGNPLEYLETVKNIISMEEKTDEKKLKPPVSLPDILSAISNINMEVEHFLKVRQFVITWDNRKAIASFFNQKLKKAEAIVSNRALNSKVKPEEEIYEKRINLLSEKSFLSLTNAEVRQMQDLVIQFVRKLKDTIENRRRRQKKGVLDLKKTLRSSFRYQGVPFKIIYRNRPKAKGKIVALCDVSTSVWEASRFMLNMLYSFQGCFSQVRSFIFVADLCEITKTLEKHEINRALDYVIKDARIDYNQKTNYGAVFSFFYDNHIDILNKKTTLIIIGDGRSNFYDTKEDIFEKLKNKTKRIIWLNPESTMFWKTGDSLIETYGNYCHKVCECQNLIQLEAFIKTLVI